MAGTTPHPAGWWLFQQRHVFCQAYTRRISADTLCTFCMNSADCRDVWSGPQADISPGPVNSCAEWLLNLCPAGRLNGELFRRASAARTGCGVDSSRPIPVGTRRDPPDRYLSEVPRRIPGRRFAVVLCRPGARMLASAAAVLRSAGRYPLRHPLRPDFPDGGRRQTADGRQETTAAASRKPETP